MFNWICPKCGSEVLASYSECPQCAKAAAPPAPGADPVPEQPPAPQPVQSAPQVPPAPRPAAPPAYAPPPAAAPQYYMQPAPRQGMPTWLLSIIFSLAFVGLGAGVYWAIQHFKEGGSQVSASGTTLETPAGKAGAKPNPYQKFIEVTGVRLYQDSKKKVAARFLVVNHSEGEMADLSATVEIRGRTAKEGEEAVGSFKLKVPSLGPNESKEMTVPVDTKLKVYELPDWQMIDTRVQVTAP
jgi:hypothetical protein